MFTVQPSLVGDRYLVKRDEAETQTESGIQLPQNAQKRPLKGTVVARNEEGWFEGTTPTLPRIAVGDRVYFTSYGIHEIEYEDQPFVILREEDIFLYHADQGPARDVDTTEEAT